MSSRANGLALLPLVAGSLTVSTWRSIEGNYPGNRTRSHATPELRKAIQRHLPVPIVNFPIGGDEQYNGAYQWSVMSQETWIHSDGWNNWAGVLYLTPDAPSSAGTGLFRHKASGSRGELEAHLRGLAPSDIDNINQDFTKWDRVDSVGNVFNRLVLFDASNFHDSLDKFGHNITTSRMFQTFFFTASAGGGDEDRFYMSAVRVSGAGSDEMNGIYKRKGADGRAPRYTLEKAGRTFVLLRVNDEDGDNHWWNIMEVLADQSYKLFYAAPEHDRAQPPQSEWQGSTHTFDFPDTLVGLEPNPSLQITRVATKLAGADPSVAAGKTEL